MGGRIRFHGPAGPSCLLVGVLGCGAPATTQPEPMKAVPEEAEPEKAEPEKTEPAADTKGNDKEAPVDAGFEAVVRFDEKPSGKKFQGVWLERKDGERYVVAYRPQAWLRGFEGRSVKVTGSTYEPQGQRISATHFRIDTLKVERRGEGPILEVGPERTLIGNFKSVSGSPGTKAEGSTWWVFVTAEGAEYEVEGAPEKATLKAGAAKIVARVVEPDMSFVARRGGPCVWVLEIEAAE